MSPEATPMPTARYGSNAGQPLTRRDGLLKVTGRATYAADNHPDGMLYAVTAVSRIARGRVTSLDVAAAKAHPGVVEVLQTSYQHPDQYWAAYEVSERLVDVEINFQSWRFHHMKTVERIIGGKAGTGGTSGVKFLQRALDTTFFPELIEVRTKIG